MARDSRKIRIFAANFDGMTFETHLTHPIYAYVQQAADALGYDAYVVGGVVRDLIMRRHNTDIDIVTVGSGIELATKTAELISPDLHVNVYRNFGTAQFHFEGCVIEFVGARRESYNRDSRKPIVEDGAGRHIVQHLSQTVQQLHEEGIDGGDMDVVVVLQHLAVASSGTPTQLLGGSIGVTHHITSHG